MTLPVRCDVLTYSYQQDERHCEVVVVKDVRILVLLVDAGYGEAQQHQQWGYGEAEVDPDQTWQLRPGFYLEDREKNKAVDTFIKPELRQQYQKPGRENENIAGG